MKAGGIMHKVKISVRRLAEFMLKSGDIDRSIGAVSDAEAMAEGRKIHKKIQKLAGPDYRAEVTLKTEYVIDGTLSMVLEGRADGIIEVYKIDGSGEDAAIRTCYTIDEIKGTYTDVRYIENPLPEHMGQAMCYAYIYASQHQLEKIDVQVTYVNIENEKIKRFTQTKTFTELETWFQRLISGYAKWVKWQLAWRSERNESVQSVHFPFEYRAGQKKMIAGVYQTIVRHKKLFMEAPTGTGKTISVIFPAMKAMGGGMAEKIFYLTAKTITRTVAEETYQLLRTHGLAFKSITLTAREKICVLDKAECNPESCARAKGHFDRINDAVFDLITHESAMSREVIEAYAEKYCVCPFEMQLDAALWVDGIIGDYNYVFDPQVYLKRFFDDVRQDYIFLIDEAHNLVDRAREMYSAPLYMSQFETLKKEVVTYNSKLALKIEKCRKYLAQLREECEGYSRLDSVGGLAMLLMRMTSDMEIFLKSKTPVSVREKVLSLYLEARRFIQVYDNMDDRYMIYDEREENNEFMVRLFCVDPSENLEERLAKGISAVFFSATLLPIRYYKELLSTTPDEDYDLYADSPFSPGHRLIMLAGDVSSKYTRRGKREYEKIAEYIMKIVRSRNGNYMVFFPSYAFMEEVYAVISEKELMKAGSGLRVIVQESAMTEEARQNFLDHFKAKAKTTVIGMCVLGGIFSEGIDLKEDRLIGAVIVGTGLPQTGSERELLKNYFDGKNGQGFDFAYLYPGMNKVLQAGGRVIRTENDRGVIALLDERFGYRRYEQLFPREWVPNIRVSLDTIEEKIDAFWEDGE